MARTADLIAYLDGLLDAPSFDDYGPNGLQVPGTPETTTVLTGVSAHVELFERAIEEQSQLVLVHHGIFWGNSRSALTPALARRLRLLLVNDLNLAAYHLPLDAHLEHGNNALIATGLGAGRLEPFGPHNGRPIGVAATFPDGGVAAGELIERVAALTKREPLAFAEGPDRVERIGIVSGGGGRNLDDAIAAGLDAFLTGEPEEPAMADAREAGIHVIAAGHYATETFGVRRLGELLAERFGVRHVFAEIPNPV